jgi:hypothetical protein
MVLKLFQRAPGNNVLVKVHGSEIYDGEIVFATIDKSSDVPTFRDNFFNCYGLYVLTLSYNWVGYPLQNGKVEFLEGVVKEMKEEMKNEKENEMKEEEETKDEKPSVLDNVRSVDDSEKQGFNMTTLLLIIFGIFFI